MPLPSLLTEKPPVWPRFDSPLRKDTAITARLGRVLGIAFTICFLTGLISHYQYGPWHWLPVPGSPKWGYRLTQGVHVITGIACIPLILLKLWSVFHRLFQWPAVRSLPHALERVSVAVLVSSSVLQLATGFLNILQWYPWPWDFVKVHYWLSFVIIGSLLLHIAIQLPKIKSGLATPVWKKPVADSDADADSDSDADAGSEHSATVGARVGLTRRGVLIAGGAGVGLVVATTAGQVVPYVSKIALLAPRRPDKAPDDALPVNKTAADAKVIAKAKSPDYRFTAAGPKMFELSLADLQALPTSQAVFPIACVEGWSKSAHWMGPKLLDLVIRAGGDKDSTVVLRSLAGGAYNTSVISGGQLERALLATHLNGERLSLDHGYPVRLIAPDRPGVFQTKWLAGLVIR